MAVPLRAAAGDTEVMTPPAEAAPAKRKRARAPKIDIDAAIAGWQLEAKRAAKVMAEAKTAARNERRKKQRLMKKAQTLSAEDLERIALLKRVGLWDPELGLKGAAVAAEDGTKTDAAPALAPPVTAPPQPAPDKPAEPAPATPAASEAPSAAEPGHEEDAADE